MYRHSAGLENARHREVPQIVFKSEQIKMTGTKSMEISGTLTLLGVTRPVVLSATYNGGYSGMPGMDPHAAWDSRRTVHSSAPTLAWSLGYPLRAAPWASAIGRFCD